MSAKSPHNHFAVVMIGHILILFMAYYLCSILDGYSRFLVRWDLRESITEADIEIILERAKERYPGAGRE